MEVVGRDVVDVRVGKVREKVRGVIDRVVKRGVFVGVGVEGVGKERVGGKGGIVEVGGGKRVRRDIEVGYGREG